MRFGWLIFVFGMVFLSACNSKESQINKSDIRKKLGHYLFFDTRLSFNNTKSCASCHDPKLAFSDGYRTSITTKGEHVSRNSPSLMNIGGFHFYNWADSTVTTLQMQHLRPMFGKTPIELGLHLDSQRIFNTLSKDPTYKNLLFKLGLSQVNEATVLNAIAEYVGDFKSYNSKYDAYINGKVSLSNNEMAGLKLFRSEKFQCAVCHPPPEFTNNIKYASAMVVYPYSLINSNDSGLFKITNTASDINRFRIPGLRNIGLTAPYFHNGSAATLIEVLSITPHAAYNISTIPKATNLSTKEKEQLTAFLFTLTDSTIFANPKFHNPY